MYKLIPPHSWTNLPEEQDTFLFKVSSRGLIGADRQFALKHACHEFVDYISQRDIPKGVLPIHLKAVHATEAAGPNFNGDGFCEDTCKQIHSTFVTHAKIYRNHDNRDPKKSYGAVEKSLYHPKMRRIELLVFGNADQDGVDRQGGLALPGSILSKLDLGDIIPWSMSCRLPHDVCVNCGNKAPSRAHYCTEETCVNPDTGYRGFGCRRGLTNVADDGFVQYVENPNCTMFDISFVDTPADPAAYGGKIDYCKAAGLGALGGAYAAEKWQEKYGSWQPGTEENLHALSVLRKLAEYEQRCLSSGFSFPGFLHAPELRGPRDLGRPLRQDPDAAMAAIKLARVLPPIDAIISAYHEHVATKDLDGIERATPGAYLRLWQNPEKRAAIASLPKGSAENRIYSYIEDWASRMKWQYGLDDSIQKAAGRQLRGSPKILKPVKCDPRLEKLADAVAFVKVAMLSEMRCDDYDLALVAWSNVIRW